MSANAGMLGVLRLSSLELLRIRTYFVPTSGGGKNGLEMTNTHTDSLRWQRVKSLLAEAYELDSVELKRYLNLECRADASLSDDLESVPAVRSRAQRAQTSRVFFA
jgi:hypothetical protein